MSGGGPEARVPVSLFTLESSSQWRFPRQIPPASVSFRGLPPPHIFPNPNNISKGGFRRLRSLFASRSEVLAARRFAFHHPAGRTTTPLPRRWSRKADAASGRNAASDTSRMRDSRISSQTPGAPDDPPPRAGPHVSHQYRLGRSGLCVVVGGGRRQHAHRSQEPLAGDAIREPSPRASHLHSRPKTGDRADAHGLGARRPSCRAPRCRAPRAPPALMYGAYCDRRGTRRAPVRNQRATLTAVIVSITLPRIVRRPIALLLDSGFASESIARGASMRPI